MEGTDRIKVGARHPAPLQFLRLLRSLRPSFPLLGPAVADAAVNLFENHARERDGGAGLGCKGLAVFKMFDCDSVEEMD